MGGLALAVLITLLFYQFRTAPPLLDDVDEMDYIQSRPGISELFRQDCYGLFRPVKNMLFLLVTRTGPVRPIIWHGLSWLLFLTVTGLAWAVFRRLLRQAGWAMAAAALFALAPTQVSSLAWFSCANILAMTGLLLAALLAYDEARQRAAAAAWPFWLLAATAYGLALFSYESALCFPVLLILWDAVRGRPTWCSSSSRRAYFGFALLAVGYAALRYAVRGQFHLDNENIQPQPAWHLTLASAWFTVDHLSLWLWPFGRQNLLGTFVWQPSLMGARLLPAWGLAGGVALTLFLLRHRRPLVAFGGVWFVVAFLPTSNFIPLRSGPFADYYLVLPSFGLALVLTDLLRWLWARQVETRRVRRATALGALALVCLLTVWRGAAAAEGLVWASAWNSPVDLLQRTLAARPESYAAEHNLARLYLINGQLEEARHAAEKAQQQAPWSGQAWMVLGDVHTRQGRAQAALACYEKAAALRPGDGYPLSGRGYVYETLLNDAPQAETCYRQALALRWTSSSLTAAINLSRLLAMSRRLDEALQVIAAALQHAPAAAELHHNAALACQQKGDLAAARRHQDAVQQLQEQQQRAAGPAGSRPGSRGP